MRALAQHLYAVLLLAGALLVPSFSFAEEGSDDYPAKFSSNTAAVNDVLYDTYQASLDAALAWWLDANSEFADCVTVSPTAWSSQGYWYHDITGCGGGRQTAPPTCSYPGAPGGGTYDHTVDMCVVGEPDPQQGDCAALAQQPPQEKFYAPPMLEGSTCDSASNCQVKHVGGGCYSSSTGQEICFSKVSYTGEQCAGSEPSEPADEPQPSDVPCELKPSAIPGGFYCDGELIFPDGIPPNGCILTKNGVLWCGDEATPLQDTDGDGQGDTPAPVTGEITHSDGGTAESRDGDNVPADDDSVQKTGDSNCGGVNQPPCETESDMPDQQDVEYPGEGMYDDLTGRDNLADYQAPLSSESQLTDKFSVFDTRSCSPLDFGSIDAFGQSYGPLTIDLCQYADWVRAIIFALLAGYAIIGIWETFNRTIRGT